MPRLFFKASLRSPDGLAYLRRDHFLERQKTVNFALQQAIADQQAQQNVAVFLQRRDLLRRLRGLDSASRWGGPFGPVQ